MKTPDSQQREKSFLSKVNVLSSVEGIILRKDFAHIWGRRGMRFFLVLIPILMAMVVPITFFSIISLTQINPSADVPKALQALLGSEAGSLNYRQSMAHTFVSFICPIFYLSVPVIVSITAATSAFVMESENGTLETLMISAALPREIFNAKISGSVLLSIVISLISFVLFAITATVGNFVLWTPFFFTPSWLILLLGLMPALAVFCVVLVALKLSKIHSSKEALKIMGYFILAIVSFYMLQLAGVYVITAQLLLIISLALMVIDVVLFNIAWRRFTPENQLEKVCEK